MNAVCQPSALLEVSILQKNKSTSPAPQQSVLEGSLLGTQSPAPMHSSLQTITTQLLQLRKFLSVALPCPYPLPAPDNEPQITGSGLKVLGMVQNMTQGRKLNLTDALMKEVTRYCYKGQEDTKITLTKMYQYGVRKRIWKPEWADGMSSWGVNFAARMTCVPHSTKGTLCSSSTKRDPLSQINQNGPSVHPRWV